MIYTAKVFGWMTVIDAPNKRTALRFAKASAQTASLLRSDVTASHVHRATEDDIAWYRSMSV